MDETLLSIESNLTKKIDHIQLTLDNVTNRNIQIIAKGHLNLSRRLDEVLKVESEREMLHLRVNIMGQELKDLKEKVDSIA